MIPIGLMKDRGAIEKQFETGEHIYEEGSLVQFYYQVLSGRIRISNFLEDGKEVLHKIIAAEECFGEVSIFEGGNHISTAIADSNCIILKISAKSFLAILDDFPEFNRNFLQLVAKDLRFKVFMSKLIYSGCPEKILFNMIQYFNNKKTLICPKCKRLLLTRQQLANMTGLRVETVIRAMKQMEKNDKLNIVRGKVFVPADGL